jgi:hypothetical protein
MNLSVRSAGSWHPISSLFVKDRGSWRNCSAAWVRRSGTWVQVFSGAIPYLTGANFLAAWRGSAGSTFISFHPDGRVDTTGNPSSRWANPPAAEPYYIRLTEDSGPAPVLGSVGNWLPLADGQTWKMEAAGMGQIRQQTLTYSISADQQIILASGLLTFLNDNS